jgi:hypothetical protein
MGHDSFRGVSDLALPLAKDGFTFVRGPRMRDVLEAHGAAGWDAFAASWDDLGVDAFMADGGRYRRRRFACFAASATEAFEISRKPHQPHYQSRDYNPLNGGVERWFLPIKDEAAAHPVMRAVLAASTRLFSALTPEGVRPPAWHVEVHQFRIETGAERGQPTPEGMHRDGVDWVLVMLVRRENVASGETRMEDVARRHVGAFTLEAPMDAALVDDGRVFHGVTGITRLDAARPAFRDVLVVTLRRP